MFNETAVKRTINIRKYVNILQTAQPTNIYERKENHARIPNVQKFKKNFELFIKNYTFELK